MEGFSALLALVLAFFVARFARRESAGKGGKGVPPWLSGVAAYMLLVAAAQISYWLFWPLVALFALALASPYAEDPQKNGATGSSARSVAQETAALRRISKADAKPRAFLSAVKAANDAAVAAAGAVRREQGADALGVGDDFDAGTGLDDEHDPGWRIDHVTFRYRDINGHMTDREVFVQFADREHFKGFCQSRQATRTFRYDRVVGKVVSLETGELMTMRAWRRNIGA